MAAKKCDHKPVPCALISISIAAANEKVPSQPNPGKKIKKSPVQHHSMPRHHTHKPPIDPVPMPIRLSAVAVDGRNIPVREKADEGLNHNETLA